MDEKFKKIMLAINRNDNIDNIIKLVFELNQEQSDLFYSIKYIGILSLAIQKKHYDFVEWYLTQSQEIINNYNNSLIPQEINTDYKDIQMYKLKKNKNNILNYSLIYNYPLLQAIKVPDNEKIIKYLLKKGLKQYVIFDIDIGSIYLWDFILTNEEYLKLLYKKKETIFYF